MVNTPAAPPANAVPFAEPTQLTQVQVPLDDAAGAFMQRDANGRIPIVVVPQRLGRIRNQFVVTGVVVLLAGILGTILLGNFLLAPLALLLAIVLIIFGVYQSFIVRVPEGVNALLARGGRYSKTVGSGTQILPPWIQVTHLVSRREIPFDVPVLEAPTQDNVRAALDTLVTFNITDPYRFVYSIAPDDFDEVFQAACQDRLRTFVRQINVNAILDLAARDLNLLRDQLGTDVAAYGVTVSKIAVTYAQPPADFMKSQEARQLAVFRQAEQAEQQALAVRKQQDVEALQQQEAIARVERERELLELQVQVAETRKRLVELEAQAQELHLQKLEERLEKYPHAAKWEWETEQLKVAQALAGNTRAVVQIGQANDITRAFLMREMAPGGVPGVTDSAADSANGSVGPKSA